jgi:UDP-N-acetylmuramoyl-tripeptide--D-alanyl-D-alanine ligase
MGEALKTHTPPPGRMRIIEGREDTAIIDDTYNSSPVAALSALDVLSEIKGQGRRITVLGDMMELGTYTVQAHRDVGKRVAEVADLLYAVGIRSQYMAEAAHKHKMKKRSIHVFDNAREAAEKLSEDINTDDVILVKGSQSMRMERIVEKLMAHPEKREKLLVRQDSVWQKKT